MWRDPRVAAALLLLLAVVGVPGLKDVQVSVPEAVAAGDTVSLHCRYDLEQDLLYSVKWYRGRQEFFRYIPKELPHTKVFPLPGVDVDVGRSGPSGVVLRSVSPPISGRYRCEVSADAPSFHTSMKTSYMHVVELPDSAPVITAEKARVSVGDTLRVRCTAPPAYPPANLTWLLNNMPVKGTPMDLDPPAQQKPTKRPVASSEQSFLPSNRNTTRLFGQVNSGHGNDPEVGNFGYVLRGQRNTDAVSIISKNAPRREEAEYTQRNIDDMFPKKSVEEKFYNHRDSVEVPGMRKIDPVRGDLVKRSSGSSLVLAIRQESFQQGRLTLSCRASVFSLYNAQAHLILEGESPQIASVLGTRESSSGAAPGSARKVLYLSLLLVAFQR